jgi:Flp pilus assembly pilin Flp
MLRIKYFLNEQLEQLRRLPREAGQTLVEYGIIVMLLALVSISILTILGGDVVNLFTEVSSDFREIDSRTP